MKSLIQQLKKIEDENHGYFSKSSSYQLKHYLIQKPYPKDLNLTYVDLDENALKNYPLPKEIEAEFRMAFKIRESK